MADRPAVCAAPAAESETALSCAIFTKKKNTEFYFINETQRAIDSNLDRDDNNNNTQRETGAKALHLTLAVPSSL